jgi:hypothetical protein
VGIAFALDLQRPGVARMAADLQGLETRRAKLDGIDGITSAIREPDDEPLAVETNPCFIGGSAAGV